MIAIRDHLEDHKRLALQGPHIAAGISSAWCTRDQRFCCAGLAQASTVPLDQGSVQAEGLSPSEAVREMDSACKRRERDRERRKRKREQAAAVAVADGTALHVSEAGCVSTKWLLQVSQMGLHCMAVGLSTLDQDCIA